MNRSVTDGGSNGVGRGKPGSSGRLRSAWAPALLMLLASCASAQFTPIIADGWMAYREVRHCAPTLAELVLSPTLFGRVKPGDEPMTLIIRWRDGSEQMARVKLERGRACLDAWKSVEMVA